METDLRNPSKMLTEEANFSGKCIMEPLIISDDLSLGLVTRGGTLYFPGQVVCDLAKDLRPVVFMTA